MEKDLGTRLDWVSVDHWNTEHPAHPSDRARRPDDGENLVISRDYIKEVCATGRAISSPGISARAASTSAAAPTQVDAERWTQLDRQLVPHDPAIPASWRWRTDD